MQVPSLAVEWTWKSTSIASDLQECLLPVEDVEQKPGGQLKGRVAGDGFPRTAELRDETAEEEGPERADDAVLAYLERHDYDGNIVQNKEGLTLYIGGMEFQVESLFVDGNCNPSAFGASYEMEADIRINHLGSEDNLRKIIKYCENN